MRTSVYIGIGVALLSVLAAIIAEGASLSAFFKISALLLIFGGTAGATYASFSHNQILLFISLLKRIFFSEEVGPISEIFLDFSEKARRNGLLCLEDEITKIEDTLLQKGIRLIVDGSDPSVVEDILYESAEEAEENELVSAKILETAGGFSPTMGIIGTVMGLVHVLENLNSGTQALGRGIATAFIATFYGIGLANLILIPMANKVRAYSKSVSRRRHAIIRGVLSLQSGDNRRIMMERMSPFLDEVAETD